MKNEEKLSKLKIKISNLEKIYSKTDPGINTGKSELYKKLMKLYRNKEILILSSNNPDSDINRYSDGSRLKHLIYERNEEFYNKYRKIIKDLNINSDSD